MQRSATSSYLTQPFTLLNSNNGLFFTLLLLLVWLPIPLGSNRIWAWSIMEVVSYWLFIAIFLQYSLPKIRACLRPYKPLVVVLGLFQIWQLLQFTPLPPQLLNIVSPNSFAIQQFFVNDAWMTISLDVVASKIAFMKGLSYYLLLIVTLVLINTYHRLKWLMLTFVVAGTLQAVYGSLQALSGNDLTWFLGLKNADTANGSFIYKNHFANFLLLCLAIGVGYMVAGLVQTSALNRKDKMRHMLNTFLAGKAAVRIALAIMVIALVLSRSRMGNSAFFMAITLTGVLALWLIKNKNKNLALLLVSLLVIDTFILGAYFGIDKVKQRIEQTSMASETRDEVNVYSLELIKQFPETGTGGGSFYSTFPSVQGNDVFGYYDHAHDDYAQFAVEYGLPATIGLGMIVLLSLWHALVAMRERRSVLMQGLGFGSSMAIIGMLMHISVDFQLQAPANAAYFVIILGLAWLSRFGLRSKPRQSDPLGNG